MPAKTQFISSLQPGATVLDFFLVRRSRLHPFKDPNAGSFLSLLLSDRTGEIGAQVWDRAEELADLISPGIVVKVQGRVRRYQQRTYLAIRQIRPARPHELAPTDYDLSGAAPAAERNVEALLGVLRDAIRTVGNLDLQRLFDSIFGDADFLADFCQARASSLHHAYAGGLLEHTVEMLVLSRPLLALFPAVNGNLLTAAILLHDVGRVLEAAAGDHASRLPATHLVGHQALGDAWLVERIAQIPNFAPDLALRLRHCILSHHGYAGTPGPATLEALALARLNNLSAELSEATQAARQAQRHHIAWTSDLIATRGPLYVGQESS